MPTKTHIQLPSSSNIQDAKAEAERWPTSGAYQTFSEACLAMREIAAQMGNGPLSGMAQLVSHMLETYQQISEELQWHLNGLRKGQARQQKLFEELKSAVQVLNDSFPSLGSGKSGLSASPGIQSELEIGVLLRHFRSQMGRLVDLIARNAMCVPMPEGPGESPDACCDEGDVPPEESEAALQKVTAGQAMRIPVLAPEAGPATPPASPSLAVYLLSQFRVLLDDHPLVGWPNCRGKAIFKYLITHRERPIPKEVLMETFWPEADPDSARNNLNVAMYGLRKILAKVNSALPYVLFENGEYLLNSELSIWLDSEAFVAHVHKGRSLEQHGDRVQAMHEYGAAESIYQTELLVEDRYEDWLFEMRQYYQDMYTTVLERLGAYYFDQHDYTACVSICRKMLLVDPCNEVSHRHLMRCYTRLGQPYLAIRQYHYCVEAVAREIQLSPSDETRRLLDDIRQARAV